MRPPIQRCCRTNNSPPSPDNSTLISKLRRYFFARRIGPPKLPFITNAMFTLLVTFGTELYAVTASREKETRRLARASPRSLTRSRNLDRCRLYSGKRIGRPHSGSMTARVILTKAFLPGTEKGQRSGWYPGARNESQSRNGI